MGSLMIILSLTGFTHTLACLSFLFSRTRGWTGSAVCMKWFRELASVLARWGALALTCMSFWDITTEIANLVLVCGCGAWLMCAWTGEDLGPESGWEKVRVRKNSCYSTGRDGTPQGFTLLQEWIVTDMTGFSDFIMNLSDMHRNASTISNFLAGK